jgi:type I restriction enzyme S subunit
MRPDTGALRYFGRIKNGTTPASGEAEYWGGEINWATPEDLGKVVGDRISTTRRQVTERAVAESNLSILPVGSVLISTRAPIGHMAINEQPIVFNQGCRGVIPSDRVHGPFLYYLLKSRVPELNAIANGTTFAELTSSELAAVRVTLPLFEAQRRITNFLDDKTSCIDALIEKKRAMLDRLTEKRQALITHAVTKGLNPTALMKDSGIDWLGEIPAHWQVIALNKVTTKITNGYVGPTRDIFFDEGVRYIQSLHIKSNRIIFKDDFFVAKEWSDAHAKSILRLDDVLVVQTGDIGQVARVNEEHVGCNCHALIICSPEHDRLDGAYLSWLFNSDYGQEFLQLVKTGALHPHLNCGHVKFFDVLIPPMDEQSSISQYLDKKLAAIAIAVDAVHESILQLNEYRAALITNAVTGQLDLEAA